MSTNFQQYLKSLDLNDSADPNVTRNVENQWGFQFPKEYVKFLLHSNGGEGPIGDNYLQLWKIEELIENNEPTVSKNLHLDC